jgi:signal transduction histidine kinase
MAQFKISTLQDGLKRLKENPQLWWTIFVAVVIFFAFIFVADRFVSIAQDAQDRLINVRIGSIHDTLIQYVDKVDDEELNKIVQNIANANPTIQEFRVISTLGDEQTVIASLKSDEIGGIVQSQNQLVSFALTDLDNSYTTEVSDGDNRYYITTRAFQNRIGEVVGYIETRQTLSEADRIINDNIRKSIFIFVLILVFVMILFLRHAKIIDYVSLYKRLKEVDQLKDDFISMASHELKSPLASIRGYAEFLRDARELNDKNKEYARRIDVSSKQLAELVADMLDVSRIEQGRMKFEFTTFAIVPFLREQFETFELQAEQKGLEMKFEVEGDEGQEIRLDSNRLRQIFINFLSNAVKYTEEGGVMVKIVIKKDESVEIRVSDTGIGMTQEQSSKLFQKFSRVQTKETEEISGTGLGLWITKQLVEKMGGQISVESIKGKGTDFVVIFPVK